MIVSGLFDRLPELRIVIGHMGELLPFAMARTQQRLAHVTGLRLERSPEQCLQENFWLTTSGKIGRSNAGNLFGVKAAEGRPVSNSDGTRFPTFSLSPAMPSCDTAR